MAILLTRDTLTVENILSRSNYYGGNYLVIALSNDELIRNKLDICGLYALSEVQECVDTYVRIDLTSPYYITVTVFGRFDNGNHSPIAREKIEVDFNVFDYFRSDDKDLKHSGISKLIEIIKEMVKTAIQRTLKDVRLALSLVTNN